MTHKTNSFVLVVAAMSTACIPSMTTHTKLSKEYVPSGQAPTVESEQKVGALDIAPASDGEWLTLVIRRGQMCRTVTSTPRAIDEVTEHRVEGIHAAANVALAVGAGIIGGDLLIDSKCGDAACTSTELSTRRTIGGVVLSLAVLPIAAEVYNQLRGKTTTKVVAREPEVSLTEWTSCGGSSAKNESVKLQFGKLVFVGKSNSSGSVSFQLTETMLSQVPADGGALVTVGNGAATKVGFEMGMIKKRLDTIAVELRRKSNVEEFYKLVAGFRVRNAPYEFADIIAMKRMNRLMLTLSSEDIRGLGASGANELKKKIGEVEAWFKIGKNMERVAEDVTRKGRKVVNSKLKAPSSTVFVSDTMLAMCDNGYVITSHGFDSQNGFGAMIRGSMCVAFDSSNGDESMYTSFGGSSACELAAVAINSQGEENGRSHCEVLAAGAVAR